MAIHKGLLPRLRVSVIITHNKSTKPQTLRSPTLYMCAAKQVIATNFSLFLSFFFFPVFPARKIRSGISTQMKLSGLLAASVAAASATVVTVSAPAKVTYQDGLARKVLKESSSVRSSSGNKFAPRFDGLRFIETLVTAHR